MMLVMVVVMVMVWKTDDDDCGDNDGDGDDDADKHATQNQCFDFVCKLTWKLYQANRLKSRGPLWDSYLLLANSHLNLRRA